MDETPIEEALQPFAPAENDEPSPEIVEQVLDTKAPAKTIGALSAKVTMLSERLKGQEQATARMQSTVERLDASITEITKKTQPMLETLSAELARQGATLETLKTDTESSLEAHGARVGELEQRLANVLREMRELVAAKLESFDATASERLDQARQAIADQLSTFEERVEELVRGFAAQSIPEEMRRQVDELSSRFVSAESALAATRSSVEFLRSEVGSLTITVRKLSPGGDAS